MAHLAMFLPQLRGGGAERVMVELAGGFLERGHRVRLVVNRRAGELADQLPAGLEVTELRGRGASGAIVPLARWLRRERPEALLSAMTHANLAALAAVALSRTRIRAVVSEHNAVGVRIANAKNSRERLQFSLARRVYPAADAIVAVSRGVGDELVERLRLPVSKVHVVYNPVVSPRVLAAAGEVVAHPWLEDGVPLVLGVGRLSEQKGFERAIEAFALVRRARPARLVLLGEGDRRDGLLRRAAELGVAADVALPGFVPNPHAWMRRASAFVLSSRWEGFGVVVAEALAAGCPVAAFDCPHGPSEILGDGVYGELAPEGDVAALAAALGRVLDAGRDAEGDARRRARGAEFSRDTAVDRYLRLLLATGSP